MRWPAITLSFFAIATAQAQPLTFTASDGVTVHAEYRGSKDHSKPLILLFHQAGSNLHEYDTIAPRLIQLGFDTLAVDQRSGGDAYEQSNLTAAAVKGSRSYLEALKDLEAALQWASQNGTKILVWGSSYSSSLVFVLAAQNPEKISALLSFSPGEYFSSKHFVRDAAAKVKVPVFVTSSSDADEISAAKAIVSAVKSTSKTQHIPEQGTHGSSTLRPDRNPGAAGNWRAVEVFLASLK